MTLQKSEQCRQNRGFAGPRPKVCRVQPGQCQQPIRKLVLADCPGQRLQRQYLWFYCGLLATNHQSGVVMMPVSSEP